MSRSAGSPARLKRDIWVLGHTCRSFFGFPIFGVFLFEPWPGHIMAPNSLAMARRKVSVLLQTLVPAQMNQRLHRASGASKHGRLPEDRPFAPNSPTKQVTPRKVSRICFPPTQLSRVIGRHIRSSSRSPSWVPALKQKKTKNKLVA